MRDLSEAIIQHDTVEMSGNEFPNCGTVSASTEQIRPVPDSLHIFVSEHAVTPWFVGVVSEEVQIRETRAKRWSEDLSCQYPHSERGFMHISWAFEFQEPAPEEVPSVPLSPITVGTWSSPGYEQPASLLLLLVVHKQSSGILAPSGKYWYLNLVMLLFKLINVKCYSWLNASEDNFSTYSLSFCMQWLVCTLEPYFKSLSFARLISFSGKWG